MFWWITYSRKRVMLFVGSYQGRLFAAYYTLEKGFFFVFFSFSFLLMGVGAWEALTISSRGPEDHRKHKIGDFKGEKEKRKDL